MPLFLDKTSYNVHLKVRNLPALIKDLNNSETEKYLFLKEKKEKVCSEINSLLPLVNSVKCKLLKIICLI